MPVVFTADAVVKRQEPERALREFDKTVAARRLAEASGLFRIAMPLDVDSTTGRLRFERLHAFENLRDVVALGPHDVRSELIARAGMILSTVHRSLPLPDQRRTERMSPRCGDLVTGFLHGDFTLDNILFSRATGEIAIVDWSGAAWTGDDVCVGPVAEDLASMFLSIFNQRLIQRRKIRQPHLLAGIFLRAYCAAAGNATLLGLEETVERKSKAYRDWLRRDAPLQHWLYASQLKSLAKAMPQLIACSATG